MIAKPKISVIMSVYNGKPYLKEAVESILNQTYKNFEFIIVDDTSTDDSWYFLKTLKDTRIRIIRNKSNIGLANCLNIALKTAQGEYVARMDADDISYPERFTQQLKFLEKNKNISICGTWVDLVNDKGEIIGKKKYPTKNSDLEKALRWYQPLVHPTMMARASFFRQLNGYRPNYDFAEDYDLLSRALGKYKMANVPYTLLGWRLASGRRSRREMTKIDITDLKVKLNILRSNFYGMSYIYFVVKKFITTFLLPPFIKIRIAKILKLA